MTTLVHESVDNAALDARIAAMGTSPIVRVFDNTGTIPVDLASGNNTNVQLAEITAPDPCFTAAASRASGLIASIVDAVPDAAGVPAYVRVYDPTGVTALLQLDVGAEVTISPMLFATDVPFTITALALTEAGTG